MVCHGLDTYGLSVSYTIHCKWETPQGLEEQRVQQNTQRSTILHVSDEPAVWSLHMSCVLEVVRAGARHMLITQMRLS